MIQTKQQCVSLTSMSCLPDGFFELEVANILDLFPTPTLIHLQGIKEAPLFVSIMLHGNEYSGLKSVQRLLSKYQNRLPRSMYLFIGNVEAASQGERTLKGQVDFNRCWPGTNLASNQYTKLMQKVVDNITQQPLFAAIDVHNNTGTNPHYACMTDVTRSNQHVAAMFNHIALVFKQPKGVSTMAFDSVCPAVTLECGKPGDEAGIQHATDLLDALLHLDHFPLKPVAAHDLQLVKSLATVNVEAGVTFSFQNTSDVDLWFDEDFERKNFTEIESDEVFAFTRIDKPLKITNQHGTDITEIIIRIENNRIYLNKALMPAMITIDPSIIQQDCLCYLLKDYPAKDEDT